MNVEKVLFLFSMENLGKITNPNKNLTYLA
jgi:hypothetical protein